jgi:hypothetical protein
MNEPAVMEPPAETSGGRSTRARAERKPESEGAADVAASEPAPVEKPAEETPVPPVETPAEKPVDVAAQPRILRVGDWVYYLSKDHSKKFTVLPAQAIRRTADGAWQFNVHLHGSIMALPRVVYCGKELLDKHWCWMDEGPEV